MFPEIFVTMIVLTQHYTGAGCYRVCAADLGGDGDPGLPRRAQGHQRGLRDRQHRHAHHQRGELCPLWWGWIFSNWYFIYTLFQNIFCLPLVKIKIDRGISQNVTK